MDKATLGFRVKSGWAMAVLLKGPVSAPQVIDRRRVELADPKVPDSVQPFHAGLDLPKAVAARTVARLVRCVERYAENSITRLLAEYRASGYRVAGAGLVVGSTIDPAKIGGAHIRAHAEEGRLFRVVIQTALKQARLKSPATPEKELMATAVRLLRLPEAKIKVELTTMGKSVAGSWRAEDKAATLAAWMALAGPVG
jgi:hypothetical protein